MKKNFGKVKDKTVEAGEGKKVKTKEPTPKKTNRTWEAFGRSKGCFIINDPQFML